MIMWTCTFSIFVKNQRQIPSFQMDRRYSTVKIPPLQAPYNCSLSSGIVASLYD